MAADSGNPLHANVERVQAQLAEACARAGRSPADVNVLAATKYVDAATVDALVAAGITHVAENRLEALEEKQPAVVREAAWHYIGRLQSRKAAAIAARVGTIHTLATDSAARRLAAAAGEGLVLPQLFVQVNAAGDPAKDGVEPEALDAFLEALPEPLVVAGLMTMPALAEGGAEQSRPAFAALRELAERTRERHAGRHPLASLSMGTSQDWTVAVEEGATHVRLGRILYAVEEYVPH